MVVSIKCPLFEIKTCEWIGDTKTLLQHFQSEHIQNIKDNPCNFVYINETFFDINLICAFDQVFCVRCEFSSVTQKFHHNVQLIQETNNATTSSYKFVLDIESEHGNLTQKKLVETYKCENLTDDNSITTKLELLKKIMITLENTSFIISIIEVVDHSKPNNQIKHFVKEDTQNSTQMSNEIEGLINFLLRPIQSSNTYPANDTYPNQIIPDTSYNLPNSKEDFDHFNNQPSTSTLNRELKKDFKDLDELKKNLPSKEKQSSNTDFIPCDASISSNFDQQAHSSRRSRRLERKKIRKERKLQEKAKENRVNPRCERKKLKKAEKDRQTLEKAKLKQEKLNKKIDRLQNKIINEFNDLIIDSSSDETD